MSTKRKNYETNYHAGADIMRIVAGVGVILLHVTDPFLTYPPYFGIGGSSWWIINVINAFFRVSVPLFIVLSGYLLLDLDRQYNFKAFYKKRFIKIGIPTVFWLILYFLWKHWLGDIETFGDMIQRLLTADVDHLYFLFIILYLYFITPVLVAFLKNSTRKGFQILLISTGVLTSGNAIINQLYPEHSVILQKDIFTIFIPYIFYYLLGLYLKYVRFSLSTIISLSITYIYAAIFIAIVSGGVVLSYFRQAGSITIMTMTIMSFIVLIHFNNAKVLVNSKRIRRSISYLASLVFGSYLIHMILLSFVDLQTDLEPGAIGSPMWFYVFIKTGIVIIGSFAITAIGKKVPYVRVLFA